MRWFKSLLADRSEEKMTLELLIWSQNRSTGSALKVIREGIEQSVDELASNIGCSPQELYAMEEARSKMIPIEIDRAVRDVALACKTRLAA